MACLLSNARLICPKQKRDELGWLFIEHGLIAQMGTGEPPATLPPLTPEQHINCAGDIIGPGLIDMRVQSGDPGAEHLETLHSLKNAAAHGGVSAFATMPATRPVIDNAAMIDSLHLRAGRIAGPKLYCYGAMTKNLEEGQEAQMAELGMMAQAGAVGFASGVRSIHNALTMRRLMSYASMLKKPIIHHCQEASLTQTGDMNEGEISTRLGLIGWPAEAEEMILQRDLILCRLTNAQYHASHVSTKGAVRALRQAKNEGLPVTADTAPLYFLLNERAVTAYDTAGKLCPPLRHEEDRLAIVGALCDGTIDAVASDHMPVNPDMKAQPFSMASTGASGIETLLPLTLSLVHKGDISWQRALELLSLNPAQILGLEGGRLEVGRQADLVRINPHKTWQIRGGEFKSLSRITPFEGMPVEGYVQDLWVAGISYKEMKS